MLWGLCVLNTGFMCAGVFMHGPLSEGSAMMECVVQLISCSMEEGLQSLCCVL